ncbi:ArsR family transcriptional regulator [Pasteurellaceae bacterium HPA106]|uniref:VpaChn25_0724 family phage protein n=1 Tax=Spirabiliibacterium pneumoniae TaxID=221400 RepID=UPI001AAD130E|nr:ArsR family transcriptional regulator [Spirabiliibacterium pneumoniae]MBE2896752.1 ArsR family transcriptional regulator [Spirabiliibacterium pneumoniae]
MDKFSIFAQDQRLVLLRSLADAGNDANESILQDCLDNYGHRISREQVRSHLLWLQEQGCVRLDDIAGLFVAHLTARGWDVAQGRTEVYGIKKPRPRD